MTKEIDGFEISSIYWVIPVLKHLTDFEKFNKFYESRYGRKPPEDLAIGYGFLVTLIISHLIEKIIHHNRVLDLKDDPVLQRAFQGSIPFYRMPHHTALGKFVRNLVELYTPLLGIQSWKKIRKSLEGIKKLLLNPLEKSFSEAIDLSPEIRSRKGLSKHRVLELTALSFMHIYCHDLKFIKIAYNNTYKKCEFLMVQKREIPSTINKQKLFEGYKLGIEYLWYCFLGNGCKKFRSLNKINKSKNWEEFDMIFEVINQEIIHPFKKRHGTDYVEGRNFVKKKKIPTEFFNKLTKSLIRHRDYRPSTEEILDERFMWYPVKLVDSELSASCTVGFITALMGNLNLKDKTYVIKFIHPDEAGNTYSFAILIEAPSIIADYSRWWVFLDFCSDFSGTGGYCYSEICRFLEMNKDRIDLSEVEVESENLENYVKDRYYLELKKALSDLQKFKDRAKGKLLELFVAQIFSKQGYEIYWSKKILGKEFDIIAAKLGQKEIDLLIIECSTTYPAKKAGEIAEEIKNKMKIINSNFNEVSKKLGLKINPRSKIKITGLYVTTQKRKEKKLDKDIFIIDCEELKDLCKKYDINYKEVMQLIFS